MLNYQTHIVIACCEEKARGAEDQLLPGGGALKLPASSNNPSQNYYLPQNFADNWVCGLKLTEDA